jgi:quinol monooxygenase YgiN
MNVNRRKFMVSLAALAVGSTATRAKAEGKGMYGVIVKMATVPGQREALIKILIEGTTAMPGCLSYIVAKDATDENAIWITEAWDSKESHAASLSLPAVKSAIAAGRPMISGVGMNAVTVPMGGYGLHSSPMS